MTIEVIRPDFGRFQPVVSPRDSIGPGCGAAAQTKFTTFPVRSPRGMLGIKYESQFATPDLISLSGATADFGTPRLRKPCLLTFTQPTNPRNLHHSKNVTPIETFRKETDRAGMRTRNPSIVGFQAPGAQERSHSATPHSYSQDCDWRPQRKSSKNVESYNPLVPNENECADNRNFLDDMKDRGASKKLVGKKASGKIRLGPVRWTSSGDLRSAMMTSPRQATPTFVQSQEKPRPEGVRVILSANHHLRRTTSLLEHFEVETQKAPTSARTARNSQGFTRICDHMNEYSSESQRLRQYFTVRGKSSDVIPRSA
eukprot:GEMP01004554.1.p1 GENE.GEMP01004554.1~~GEMP01004554.1.p1  ORF type:complete len:313 (+),score=39.43 GEMP01004554.1:194-1132(+)